MLKKSLLILAATAILLPPGVSGVNAYSSREGRVSSETTQRASSRQHADKPQARQRARQRSQSPRTQSRRGQSQRAQSQRSQSQRSRPRAQSRQQSRAPQQSQARQQAPAQQRAQAAATQRPVQRIRIEGQPRRVTPPSRMGDQQGFDASRRQQSNFQQTRVRSVAEQQVARDSRGSRQSARQQSRSTTRAVRQAGRQQTRAVVRGRTDSSQRTVRRGATSYDYDDAARYNAHRARGDARNARVDRYRDRGGNRYRDTHRRADPYQPRVRRNFGRNYGFGRGFGWDPFFSPFRNNVFFGFGGFYSGPRLGWGVGLYDPIWPYWGGFYNTYNYHSYFGHWPFSRGFYHRRANWAWAHPHNHYHYGDYCPGFHVDDGHHFGHADYRHTGGGNAAGTLLGAVVGGIIGAEIDGGRNRTAGAIAGAVIGGALGNAATRPRQPVAPSGGTYQPYSSGARFDENGRHVYETRPYEPPEEIRTCMRYEYVGDNYRCTKWTVEYVHNDTR